MELIDTHVHLEDEAFAADRRDVLARAQAAHVTTLVNAGSSLTANQAAGQLAQQHEEIFASAGLHPHEFPRTALEDISRLPEQLCQEKIVAVGEIGLDYHHFANFPLPDQEAQQAAFQKQLELARWFELPLIIHVREAMADALYWLHNMQPFTGQGVMHCYAGGEKNLPAVLNLGFLIGVGGSVTYPRADALRAMVRTLPLDKLLLETDAPYLPPQGQRGKRNEPAWILAVAELVAKEKNLALAEVAQATTANACQLFKLERLNLGTVVYAMAGNLYINLTNRCCSHCCFCPRKQSPRIQGYDLTLRREPWAQEIIAALGNPRQYSEVVFCGFGEPLLRWPTLLQVARAVKAQGGRVRVNTNGQAEMIFSTDILSASRGWVDAWSVSLNTADPVQYQQLMHPAGGEKAHAAAIKFVQHAQAAGFDVTVTGVELPEVDHLALRALALSLGASYRGRKPERLGDLKDANERQCLG